MRQITVPDEVAAALDAETIRRPATRAEVLIDFVRTAWPTYVAQQLRSDLANNQVTVRATWAEPRQTPEVCEPTKALDP